MNNQPEDSGEVNISQSRDIITSLLSEVSKIKTLKLRLEAELREVNKLITWSSEVTKDIGSFGKTVSIPKADNLDELSLVRKKADEGLSRAQFRMGIAYLKGNGVAKDQVEAVKWWRKAAEQGHVLAQRRLGRAFQAGCGVKQNLEEATHWLAASIRTK